MRRRAFLPVLALAPLLLSPPGCGGTGETPPEEDLSVIFITVTWTSNIPTMYQIQVKAHLGGLNDSVLTFPQAKTDRTIQSGDTLALLIPTTRMGMLDLNISGLDANGQTVATGSGQVLIMVGERVDKTIVLSPV